jgi:hypothetical protein
LLFLTVPRGIDELSSEGSKESGKMRKESILKKVVAGIGSAALAIALGACAHHDAVADNGYGQIRTEAPATADSSTPVVATVNAPNNAAGVGASSTPAVISGPAEVDKSGRAYTSSSAGGTGNASNIGTNTNVNLIPKKTKSEVVVTQSPIEESTTTTVVSNSPAPIVPMTTETPVVVETPAPAPVIVETPAPTPVVVETPMTSSTTDDTTTATKTESAKTEAAEHHHHHRKMHKD